MSDHEIKVPSTANKWTKMWAQSYASHAGKRLTPEQLKVDIAVICTITDEDQARQHFGDYLEEIRAHGSYASASGPLAPLQGTQVPGLSASLLGGPAAERSKTVEGEIPRPNIMAKKRKQASEKTMKLEALKMDENDPELEELVYTMAMESGGEAKDAANEIKRMNKEMQDNRAFNNWVFTQKWVSDEIHPVWDESKMVFITYGFEIGKQSSYKHWQGYVELKKALTFSAMRFLMGPGVRIARRRGTQQQAIKYCLKDGKWFKFGTPKHQGTSASLHEMCDEIKEGKTVDEIILADPSAIHEFGRTLEKFEAAWNKQVRVAYPNPPLDWWKFFDEMVKTRTPSDRCPIFIQDVKGNGGKSHFMRWMRSQNDWVFTCTVDSKRAVGEGLTKKHKLVLLDMARTDGKFPYEWIEKVLNGHIFKEMYNPADRFIPVPHIIVLCNKFPEAGKWVDEEWIPYWTENRWDLCFDLENHITDTDRETIRKYALKQDKFTKMTVKRYMGPPDKKTKFDEQY